jgi:hypothetical protein
LPITLKSFKLAAISRLIEPSCSSLVRFPFLTSLDLGSHCFPYDIHSILVQLPKLVKLRLCDGALDVVAFKSLVSGPARLSSLESIGLDVDVGEEGTRMVPTSSVTPDDADALPFMEDWTLPRSLDSEDLYDHSWQEADALNFVEIKELIEVARDNGVEVVGSIHEALSRTEDFYLEASNRAVLAAVRGLGSGALQQVRISARRIGVPLPSFDTESLEFDKLEIVETELPEKEWFELSLRN